MFLVPLLHLLCDAEASLLLIPVHIVGINSAAANFLSKLHPLRHDLPDGRTPNIHPPACHNGKYFTCLASLAAMEATQRCQLVEASKLIRGFVGTCMPSR